MSNLYSMLRDCLTRSGLKWGDFSRISETQWIDWLNQGEATAVRKIGFSSAEDTITTVASQREYDLPMDASDGLYVAGRQIASVIYTDEDGNEERMTERSLEMMDIKHPGWRADDTETDAPTEYYIDWKARKFGLHLLPENAGDTVTIRYTSAPTPMRIIYSADSGDPGSVSISGTVVAGSNTLWVDRHVAAGMEFGILEAYRGTGIIPVWWGIVSEVWSNTSIELEHAAPSNYSSDVNHVIASRSVFSREWDSYRDIPVEFALSLAHPDMRAQHMIVFWERIRDLQREMMSTRGKTVRFGFGGQYHRSGRVEILR